MSSRPSNITDVRHNCADSSRAAEPATKPNILVIVGDDIGQTNISAYWFGAMSSSSNFREGRSDQSTRLTPGSR
jgi:hypothetical protein